MSSSRCDAVGLRVGSASPDPRSQHFRHRPRLRDAAARRERLLGVEDLAERSDARLVQVRAEAVEARARARLVVRLHPQPGVDERTHQPPPHRALVIGGVARAEVAVVLRLVVAMTGRERAQTDRREQPVADDVEAPAATRASSSTG